MSAELSAYDLILRHEVTKRDAMQSMAEYFLGQVAMHQEQIDHYTGLRNEVLGGLALDNVTPMRGEIGDIAG